MQKYIKTEIRPDHQKNTAIHEDQQEEPHTNEHDNSGRNIDLVNIRYLYFDDTKSVIYNKLESSTSQKRACITYKIDTGRDCNLMPVRVYKMFFPKSKTAKLYATKHNSVMLKRYNQSDTEQ